MTILSGCLTQVYLEVPIGEMLAQAVHSVVDSFLVQYLESLEQLSY
jgi:hypothetical protein